MRRAVDIASGDFETGRRPFVGAVGFANEVDDADRSVLDVPASRE